MSVWRDWEGDPPRRDGRPGRRPEHDGKVQVRFRCGLDSRHTYLPAQLRWSRTGSTHDIVAWRPAE